VRLKIGHVTTGVVAGLFLIVASIQSRRLVASSRHSIVRLLQELHQVVVIGQRYRGTADKQARFVMIPNLSNVTREAALFAGMNGEARPFMDPPVFYYGHTACLHISKLRVSGVLSQPVNAIFAKGVDEKLWAHRARGI
jgi:hypothetical protein